MAFRTTVKFNNVIKKWKGRVSSSVIPCQFCFAFVCIENVIATSGDTRDGERFVATKIEVSSVDETKPGSVSPY